MTFQPASGGPSVPIGSIIPFHKDFANNVSLPPEFEECDGTTINDADSPLDGLTKPDLQGSDRFLRGNTSTGGIGGRKDMDISFQFTGREDVSDDEAMIGATINGVSKQSENFDDISFNVENQPKYFDVVMAIRIK